MNTHNPVDHCDVLVVDDNRDALDFLNRGLTEAGFQVCIATDAEQALNILRHRHPEAILLDIVMPGIDGFETCQKMRQIDENVPIIFMTGLGEPEHIVRGFEVGANDYVTKPVDLAVVIARMQSHTRTARLVRTTREAISAAEAAILACDNQGRLLWCNDSAHALIAKFVPEVSLIEGVIIPRSLGIFGHANNSESDQQRIYAGANCLEIRRATECGERVAVYLLKQIESTAAQLWDSPKLTERESEVLLWVARGKTNRDIAEILGMSPRTVNKHLEHIFKKLGVETRTAAASVAANRLGLS